MRSLALQLLKYYYVFVQLLVIFRTRMEAEIAQGALAAHDIVAKLQSDNMGGSEPFPFSPELGVELYVGESDLEKAKAILQIS